MPTVLLHLKSWLTDIGSTILTVWGDPAAPATGDTDWGGVTATQAALDELYDLTDGQLLIGKTGAGSLANHPMKGTLAGSNGISITNGPGSVTVGFTPASGSDIAVTTPGQFKVTAIQHTPFSPVGPTDGQSPVYNSTAGEVEWQNGVVTSAATTTANGIGRVSVVPVDSANPIFVGDNDPRLTAPAPLTSGHIFVGNISNVANDIAMSGDATIDVTGALTLANSGVTAGTYTNPTVTFDAKGRATAAASGTGSVNIPSGTSFPVSPAPVTGDVFIRTDTTPEGLYRFNGTGWDLTGDGTGTGGGSVSLTNAHILVGNASNVATDVALSGDASITNAGALTVTRIQGKTVDTTAPTDQQVLRYINSTGKWTPTTELFVGARAVTTTSHTVSGATPVSIPMDATDQDTSGFWSSSLPTRLRVPATSVNLTGIYEIKAQCVFTATGTVGTGAKFLEVRLNGTTRLCCAQTSTTDAGDGWILNCSTIHSLGTGDYIELWVTNSTGQTLDCGGASQNTMISLHRLGS